MTLKKRLRKLEGCVLKLPELGTTKLYLKGGEANLLEQCKRIMMNWHQGGDVTSEQEVLLERLSGIAWLRAIDIFRSVVGAHICRGDALAEFIFGIRLLWFVGEVIRQINQQNAEEVILSQEGKSWRQKEKELKELGKTWRTPFSPESFRALLDSAMTLSSKETHKQSVSESC